MNNVISVKQKKNIDTIQNAKIVKLPWVLNLGPKLRKEFKKFGRKTIFTSERNLKNLICRDNSKLLPNSFPGVYEFNYTCNVLYIGETKKKVTTRADRTVSMESGKAQAQLTLAQNVMTRCKDLTLFRTYFLTLSLVIVRTFWNFPLIFIEVSKYRLSVRHEKIIL